MQAFEKPFELVADAFRLFVGSRDARVLHIRADHRILPTVAGLLAALEDRADNASPLLLSLTPASLPNHWQLRSEELRREYEDLRTTALEAELTLAPLPSDNAVGIEGCARTMLAILERTTEPFTSPIVCLVPGVTDSAAFRDDLRALLTSTALRSLRWIVVESESAEHADEDSFAATVMSVEARVEPGGVADELTVLASMSDAAGASSEPARTHGAGAGPGVVAPLRPHEPVMRTVAGSLEGTGLSAAQLDVGLAAKIRAALFRGIAASLRADIPECVRNFASARDLAIDAGLVTDAVSYEMMMASSAVHAAPEAAVASFERARLRAQSANLNESAGRAELGRAGALFVLGRHDEARSAYRFAASLTSATSPILAIEALRMAGTIDARGGRDGEAASLWHQALEIGRASDAPLVARSSAPLTARSLADLCESHRLYEQAASLRAEAKAMETTQSTQRNEPSPDNGTAPSRTRGET